MNGKVIGGVIAIVVIAGLGWYFFGSNQNASSQSAAPMSSETDTSSSTPLSLASLNPNQTVTYTDQCYSPQFVTIPQGGTVMFVNQSSHGMWVATDPHPLHNGYD